MRDRGMTQSEMARAIGASQPTVSRLLNYLDSLSSAQAARVIRERGPNLLVAMVAAEDKRRAIRDEIYAAYNDGDMERVNALWREEQSI